MGEMEGGGGLDKGGGSGQDVRWWYFGGWVFWRMAIMAAIMMAMGFKGSNDMED